MEVKPCSCGIVPLAGMTFDPAVHCRACTIKSRYGTPKPSIELPVVNICPYEGSVVEWAPCNCQDKHVRQCLHPNADHDLFTRGANSGKNPAIASCVSCNLPRGVITAKEVRQAYGPVGFTWCHYGDLGDVVASLRVVYGLCVKHDRQAEYYLYPVRGSRALMDHKHAKLILPLLEAQPYIAKAGWRPEPYGVQLSTGLRKFGEPNRLLCEHYHHWLNEPFPDVEQPWLSVAERRVAPVVINRTERYHAPSFPWAKIVEATRPHAIFVGTEQEHRKFCSQFGEVPHYKTATLLDVAEVIAGSELFIGNQSSPANIAEGLKRPLVLEEDPAIPDVYQRRAEAWRGSNREFWCPALDQKWEQESGISLLGVPDPLPIAYQKNRDDWRRTPMVKRRHWNALKEIVHCRFEPPRFTERRGIVTCGEGKYWPSVLVLAKMIRHVGCQLPIEVWFRSGVSPVTIGSLADLGVTVHDVDAMAKAKGDWRIPFGEASLGAWEAKFYALMHTRFESALWIDADSYPTCDPSPMLDAADQHGVVVWQDTNQAAIDALRWNEVHLEEVPEHYRRLPAINGGHMAFHRPSAWQVLAVTNWMCQHSDFYFGHLFGDQDSLRVACAMTDTTPYVFGCLRHLPTALHLYQLDYEGKPMFVHRSGPKMMTLDIPLEATAARYFAEAMEENERNKQVHHAAGTRSPVRHEVLRGGRG